MSRWLISVPVWGAPYVRTFCERAAPALLAATRALLEPARFLVHTDDPAAVRRALAPELVEVRPTPQKPTYVALQDSHADAVAVASPGDRVVLLNADLVVSGNLLVRCAAHFALGMQAVVLIGIRTEIGPDLPPVGAPPRDLLAWAWDHRHQIIRDLEWPHGGSMLPTNLFWEAGPSVVARAFHQHPVAIVKQENTAFRSTIDGDLLDCFPREVIHVVTDPDDCAMLECSDPRRRFPVRGQHFTPALVAGSMRSRASVTHRWLFSHRVVVRGTGAEVADDADVARRILDILETPPPQPPRMPERLLGRVPGGPRGRVVS